MEKKKRTARIAGAIYLLLVLTGIFHLMYIPLKLFDMKDASATMHQIIASESLFRLGILIGITSYIAFLILPFALYQFLNSINKNVATVMVILAVVSVPISIMNMENKFAILALIDNEQILSIADPLVLQSQIMSHLNAFNDGNLIASVFWGLWLFPFGFLVYKSEFLPKILGLFLMIGCIGYVIEFICSILFSQYATTGISTYIHIPGSIGEIGICLWLCIKGVHVKKQKNKLA